MFEKIIITKNNRSKNKNALYFIYIMNDKKYKVKWGIYIVNAFHKI